MIDITTLIIIGSIWVAGLLGAALVRYITPADRRVTEHADWNGQGNLRHYEREESNTTPALDTSNPLAKALLQQNNPLTEKLLSKDILTSKND